MWWWHCMVLMVSMWWWYCVVLMVSMFQAEGLLLRRRGWDRPHTQDSLRQMRHQGGRRGLPEPSVGGPARWLADLPRGPRLHPPVQCRAGGEDRTVRPRPLLRRQGASKTQEVHRGVSDRDCVLHAGRRETQEEEEKEDWEEDRVVIRAWRMSSELNSYSKMYRRVKHCFNLILHTLHISCSIVWLKCNTEQ